LPLRLKKEKFWFVNCVQGKLKYLKGVYLIASS
jgi:hypothetical protein